MVKRTANRQIRFRLIHDGAQPGTPLAEPLHFGLQDTKGNVHAATVRRGRQLHFDFELSVKGSPGAPVFSGAFASGPPSARFVYLSWKRAGQHAAPYGWRIKIPLAGITWSDIDQAEQRNGRIEADATGRRPHASEPITWQVRGSGKS